MQERRISPRYSVDWRVALEGWDGVHYDAAADDFSLAGVGVRVSRAAVLALAQGGDMLTAGDRLQVVLPARGDAGDVAQLRVRGRVRHVRRLSQEQYLVGILFADDGPQQEAGLMALADSLGFRR